MLYGLVKTNILIVLYLQIFQNTELYSLQNLSLRLIIKIFLKFRKFQPRYSYKTYSYKLKKNECMQENNE